MSNQPPESRLTQQQPPRPVLPHHVRIAAAYEADARDVKRERVMLAIRTVGWCWAWVVVGAGLMGEGLHINASVGPLYFPRLMARAQLFFAGGFFIGTAGPLTTLLMAWRKAVSRGLIEGS